MMFQWQVDRDGNWAVGLVGCRVLASSAVLPRQDREPMVYDGDQPNQAAAERKAQQVARDYAAGLC